MEDNVTQQDNMDYPVDTPEVRLPKDVLTGVMLIVIPYLLALVVGGVLSLFGIGKLDLTHARGGWIGATAPYLGGIILLGLVVLGRFWAYMTLVVLLSGLICMEIYGAITTHNFFPDIWTALTLFCLLSGYPEYKRFAEYRRARRMERNEG